MLVTLSQCGDANDPLGDLLVGWTCGEVGARPLDLGIGIRRSDTVRLATWTIMDGNSRMAGGRHVRERDPNFEESQGIGVIHRPPLWRDVAVIVFTAIAVTVAGSFRFTPNERLPPAQALTASMDAVFSQQRSGDIVLGDEARTVAPGVMGARIDGRLVVAGEVDDVCYSMWWGESGVRRVRVMPRTVACTPSNGASDSRMNVAVVAPAAPEGAAMANWEPLWPDATRVRVWWLPLLLVAAAIALSAFVRIVVLLVTGRSVRGMR